MPGNLRRYLGSCLSCSPAPLTVSLYTSVSGLLGSLSPYLGYGLHKPLPFALVLATSASTLTLAFREALDLTLALASLAPSALILALASLEPLP